MDFNNNIQKVTQKYIKLKLQLTRSGLSGKARTHSPILIFKSSIIPVYLLVLKKLDSNIKQLLLPQVIYPISSLLSKKPRKSTKNKRIQLLSTIIITTSNSNTKSFYNILKLIDLIRLTSYKLSKFKPKSKVLQLKEIDFLYLVLEPFISNN